MPLLRGNVTLKLTVMLLLLTITWACMKWQGRGQAEIEKHGVWRRAKVLWRGPERAYAYSGKQAS